MTQTKECSESVGRLLPTGSKSEIAHSSVNWDESFLEHSKMRINSITTYLDGISQPNITLKVHST